jgi:tetratricopeptide (TPR) repeat protein
MAGCPDAGTFTAFVSGALGADAREELEGHVDTCEPCRITLSESGRGASAPEHPTGNGSLPAIGDVVGRYAIAGELGAGAMGVVYLARDPVLDRELAIKLVQPQVGAPEDELVQQRMLREGRALARIDHPNVVRVFDVRRWHGALFVAMERAPGVSLRAWLEAEPRSERSIVGVFVQCAAGLAAAHAAGVIHRDFKPENVVVDAAGRARVTDFGLAQTAATPEDEPAGVEATGVAGGSTDPRLTRTHGLVGTPAYMAPEQHRGGPLDERVDQFALCVALAEALGRVRPYAAGTVEGMLANMQAGRHALAASIGARLRRVLGRGLAYEPARRYPSMAALGRALAPPRARWSWWIAVGTLCVGLASIALAASGVVTRRDDPCSDVTRTMAATWDSARVLRLARVFTGDGRTSSGPAWTYVRAGVDAYAETWTAMRIGVCRAGVERGELDAATRDKTVRCLGRRVVELDALLARWEYGGETIATAPQSLDGLAPVDRCATPELDATPATTADGVRLRVFEARFATALAEGDVGRSKQAAIGFAALDAELTTTTFHALRAETLVELANAERALGKSGEAREHLIAGIAEAETARAERTKAAAWIALAQLAADDTVRLDEARDALRFSAPLLVHLGEPERLVLVRETASGLVALRDGDHAGAIAALRRSLAGRLPLSPFERSIRRQMLARALIAGGQIPLALAELEQAERDLTSALGPDAPGLVYVLNSMIEPLDYLARRDEAIARGRRALALLDANYGKDNPRRSAILGNLAAI